MSKLPRPPIFRIPAATSVEARGHTRVRVARDGGQAFTLSLAMLHEVDEWAARQAQPLSQTAAIAVLIRRGLAN